MQSDRSYFSGLCDVISGYIKQRKQEKPDSSGIDRAKKFLKFIEYELWKEEALHEVQLMWRMLDYVTRKNRGAPFDTSKTLRALVYKHLCDYTGVTEEKITLEERNILMQELIDNKNKTLPFFTATCMSKQEKREKAIRNIVSSELTLRSKFQLSRVEHHESAINLLAVIADYRRMNLNSCMKKEGRDRALLLEKEILRLSHVECLDEHQLLCRLLEHVALPVEIEMGYFETSKDLRMFIARSLCKLAWIDDSTLDRTKSSLRHDIPVMFHSNLGPVYKEQDQYLLELNARVKCLVSALYNKPRSFMLSTSSPRDQLEKDKSVELKQLSIRL